MYVLKNIDTGKYVAQPGSDKSYTTSIKQARKFPTREAAQADAYGNEIAVSLMEEVI